MHCLISVKGLRLHLRSWWLLMTLRTTKQCSLVLVWWALYTRTTPGVALSASPVRGPRAELVPNVELVPGGGLGSLCRNNLRKYIIIAKLYHCLSTKIDVQQRQSSNLLVSDVTDLQTIGIGFKIYYILQTMLKQFKWYHYAQCSIVEEQFRGHYIQSRRRDLETNIVVGEGGWRGRRGRGRLRQRNCSPDHDITGRPGGPAVTFQSLLALTLRPEESADWRERVGHPSSFRR